MVRRKEARSEREEEVGTFGFQEGLAKQSLFKGHSGRSRFPKRRTREVVRACVRGLFECIHEQPNHKRAITRKRREWKAEVYTFSHDWRVRSAESGSHRDRLPSRSAACVNSSEGNQSE